MVPSLSRCPSSSRSLTGGLEQPNTRAHARSTHHSPDIASDLRATRKQTSGVHSCPLECASTKLLYDASPSFPPRRPTALLFPSCKIHNAASRQKTRIAIFDCVASRDFRSTVKILSVFKILRTFVDRLGIGTRSLSTLSRDKQRDCVDNHGT